LFEMNLQEENYIYSHLYSITSQKICKFEIDILIVAFYFVKRISRNSCIILFIIMLDIKALNIRKMNYIVHLFPIIILFLLTINLLDTQK